VMVSILTFSRSRLGSFLPRRRPASTARTALE
jgi:hypothetical protein